MRRMRVDCGTARWPWQPLGLYGLVFVTSRIVGHMKSRQPLLPAVLAVTEPFCNRKKRGVSYSSHEPSWLIRNVSSSQRRFAGQAAGCIDALAVGALMVVRSTIL